MIRKAVIPAAGLGTRFLPVTKIVPKELLPIGVRPSLDFIVEEAVIAGLTHLILVVSPQKIAIVDYYRAVMDEKYPGVVVEFAVQPEAKGLGHAVACAEAQVGGEEFMVLLPDDMIDTPEGPNVTQQMIALHTRSRKSVIALMQVPREQVSAYGIVKGHQKESNVVELTQLVEKPKADEAPSTLAIVGRYLLSPQIFVSLRQERKGQLGEIQLTDALSDLAAQGQLLGYLFTGRRFDVGNPIGMTIANVFYQRHHPEIKNEIKKMIQDL